MPCFGTPSSTTALMAADPWTKHHDNLQLDQKGKAALTGVPMAMPWCRRHQLRQCLIVTAWSDSAYVPVSQRIYAAFRSKARGLLPPSDDWWWRGL